MYLRQKVLTGLAASYSIAIFVILILYATTERNRALITFNSLNVVCSITFTKLLLFFYYNNNNNNRHTFNDPQFASLVVIFFGALLAQIVCIAFVLDYMCKPHPCVWPITPLYIIAYINIIALGFFGGIPGAIYTLLGILYVLCYCVNATSRLYIVEGFIKMNNLFVYLIEWFHVVEYIQPKIAEPEVEDNVNVVIDQPEIKQPEPDILNLVCTICNQADSEGLDNKVLECNHRFHTVCIDGFFLVTPHCPNCLKN
jgi:hypothetical protein